MALSLAVNLVRPLRMALKAFSLNRPSVWGVSGAAMAVLQRASFDEEARLRGRLSDGEAMRDLLVYTAFVAGAQRQRNPRDDYYGQRTAWQVDRIRRRAEA